MACLFNADALAGEMHHVWECQQYSGKWKARRKGNKDEA